LVRIVAPLARTFTPTNLISGKTFTILGFTFGLGTLALQSLSPDRPRLELH